MTSRPAWGDVGIGIGTLVLAAVVGWQTTLIPGDAVYARVGPRAIPWAVTGLLATFGATLVVLAYLGRTRAENAGAHAAIDRAGALWMLLGLFLNISLIDYVGFIIASTLLFVCTARAFRSTAPLRDAAIGFALALIAYVGFDRVLGYKIGGGLIESLF